MYKFVVQHDCMNSQNKELETGVCSKATCINSRCGPTNFRMLTADVHASIFCVAIGSWGYYIFVGKLTVIFHDQFVNAVADARVVLAEATEHEGLEKF